MLDTSNLAMHVISDGCQVGAGRINVCKNENGGAAAPPFVTPFSE
jgi:hypothetical protein